MLLWCTALAVLPLVPLWAHFVPNTTSLSVLMFLVIQFIIAIIRPVSTGCYEYVVRVLCMCVGAGNASINRQVLLDWKM